MATGQTSPIFLEKTGAEQWTLTIHDEEIPFQTAGGAYTAVDIAYAVFFDRQLDGLVFQGRAVDGRHYAIPRPDRTARKA
jgi:hypothetical protein